MNHEISVTSEEGKIVIVTVDKGDNPVFIKGHKCWRRYRFGGYVTMRDEHDCNNLEEFYEKHMNL